MGRTTVKLTSSITPVDLAHFEKRVAAALKAGADWIQRGQRSQPCNSE
jgi:hypothetical protein